jgi:hypothetical protein
LINSLQPLEPRLVAARYGLWRTFVRELRARQDISGESELAGAGRDEQGQQRSARMTSQ